MKQNYLRLRTLISICNGKIVETDEISVRTCNNQDQASFAAKNVTDLQKYQQGKKHPKVKF